MERADISATEKNKIAKTIVSQEAKRIADAKQQAKVEAYQDRVMLHVEGWKMRYYTNKFLVTDPADVSEFISNIRQSYIEGLQWVFSYYYKGCESWDWYYPYHYAPFASDLTECEDVKVTFDIG
jgi:5'-3' exoribonuclease 2